jgi:tetratricopeptide (TPR) repeat protein
MTEETDSICSSYGEYYNLGTYNRGISAGSENAQKWFNRGLIWSYAFNHEESAQCFEQAIANDPSCAIAYWGLAYTLGPNYNKPWAAFDEAELKAARKRIFEAVKQAEENKDTASDVEKALIDALRFRYPKSDDTEVSKESQVWNESYSNSMKSVYNSFSNDLDIATLYADSLMNLTPWALWDIRTGEPALRARTLEIKEVLETAIKLEGGDSHPGILHLYIHLMEMSGAPESALRVAEKLRGLVPDAGHLRHMPTHLDILCGDWRRAVEGNGNAILAVSVVFNREYMH